MARDLFYKPIGLSPASKLRSGSVPPVRLSSITGSRASLAAGQTAAAATKLPLGGVRRLSVSVPSSCVSIQRSTAGIAWPKPDVRRTSFVGSGLSVRKLNNNNLFSPSQIRTRSSLATSLNRPLAQLNYTAIGNRKIFGLPVTANNPPMISRKNSLLDRRFSIPWNLNFTTTAHSKGYTPPKEFGVKNFRAKGGDKPVAPAKTGRSSLADTDPKDFKPRDSSRIGRVSKKSNYEDELQNITPIHEDSISKLRARTQIAKDHLSKHRILLDRYLPVQLGPDTDVVQEVENRYEELLSRMPRVQRQRSNVEDEKYFTEIEPYKPAATTSKDRMLSEIKNVSVKKSFTPKISDTRKRARSVLCKVKGDPRYYDF